LMFVGGVGTTEGATVEVNVFVSVFSLLPPGRVLLPSDGGGGGELPKVTLHVFSSMTRFFPSTLVGVSLTWHVWVIRPAALQVLPGNYE
jgi:hypothetical protein